MTAVPPPHDPAAGGDDQPRRGGRHAAEGPAGEQDGPRGLAGLGLDRQTVLDQLGGVRGMLDASLPTIAFLVADTLGGLAVGIWWALGTAVVLFLVRLVRRENVQQAVSGLIGVGIAVGIAAVSGQARDFFVLGIVRNAAIGVVLLGSIPFRWPLIGVVAEFFAPSHVGSLATPSGGGLRGRLRAAREQQRADAARGTDRPGDPEPEQHWRDDRRALRVYGWLTVLWAATFLLRVAVQGLLYVQDNVPLLGTASLVLGLPVTAVALVVTLWAVARLHHHRAESDDRDRGDGTGERPAA